MKDSEAVRNATAAEPIRVLQSGAGWFPEDAGGLERMYYGLTTHLPEFGVEPHGLVIGSTNVQKRTNGRVHAFAPPHAPLVLRTLAARRAFRKAMMRVRPHLVTAHFALYAAPWIDQISSVPFVMHFHGPWSAETAAEASSVSLKQRLQRKIEHYVYRHADRCIVLSDAFAKLLNTEYDVPQGRITVVPGGVNADRFNTRCTRAEARHALGLPLDRSILISVRRLTKRMGLKRLIDAVDYLRRDRDPSILLLIAGKGPLQKELERHIHEKSLSNHVRLLGFVPDEDLPLQYRAANMSVVPTISLEGFGLITLESLASGTPVLVTPVGGMPEPIRPLSDNLVLSGTAAEDVAQGIGDALTGRRVLPTTDECISYVRRHFDWSVIAKRTSEVYADVVAQAVSASA